MIKLNKTGVQGAETVERVRTALEILAGEARRRGMTYGKLVCTVPKGELDRLVHLAQLKDGLRIKAAKRRERSGAYGQGSEIQNE